MRRAVTIGIVGVWVVMLGLLAQRTWFSAAPAVLRPPVAPASETSTDPNEEWLGVYSASKKIGYAHQRLERDPQGWRFEQTSLLRLKVMDEAQTVRTRVRGRAAADYALRQVDFELTSGAGRLRAEGVVDGETLRLTLRTGAEESERTLPLGEPVYIASLVRNLLPSGGLQVGQHFEVLVFDPTVLTNGRLKVDVEAEEQVPSAAPGVRGWRVTEEFRGMRTTAWLDDRGGVLREQGPMGLTMMRESATDAVHSGWGTDELLDVVTQAAVPVAQPIAEPRTRAHLRLRLSGIEANRVPSDDQQAWDGTVLTITLPDLNAAATYQVPYAGSAQSEELKATSLLQSDHPRIRALARDIIGTQSEAKETARRLNQWVYTHLRKVPTMSLPNALQVLEMGEGDCNEHAVLLAALARAVGLPARVVAGAVYVDGAFLYHAWDEVWLGRWVSIDPALGQFPADATHIKFVAGEPEAQLAMMDIIGRLEVEVLPDATPAAS